MVVVLFILRFAVGKGLQWLLESSLTQATRRTRTDPDDRLIHYLTAPVVQTTVILALVVAEKSFGFGETVDRILNRLLFTALLEQIAKKIFRYPSRSAMFI